MSYISRQKLQTAARTRQRMDQFTRTPSASEAFGLAFSETTEMEMMSSRAEITKTAQSWQKDRLRELRDQGEIPEAVWEKSITRKQRGGPVDWKKLGDWANENLEGETGFDFSFETAAAQALERTQARQELLNNVSMFSIEGAATFLGTAAAIANPAKPDIIPTLLMGMVPVGPIATTSVTRAALSVAMKESVAGMLEEGITQANTYMLRNEIGDRYKVSDAVANILAGGLIQASIGTAINMPSAKRAVDQQVEMQKRAEINAEAADLRESIDVMIRATELEQAQGRNVLDFTEIPERTDVNVTQATDALTPHAEFVGPPAPRKVSPERVQAIREDVLVMAKEELLPEAGRKLSRGDVKQITAELQDLKTRLNAIEDTPRIVEIDPNDKTISKRRQKARAAKQGKELAAQQREGLEIKISKLERKLSDNEGSAAAAADLSRVEQGILPESYQRILDDEIEMELKLAQAADQNAPVDPVSGVRIMGPEDPLTPQKRAALDDLRLQRRMLDDLLAATDGTINAADARAWLDAQWVQFQKYADDPPTPTPNAARVVTDAENAPVAPRGTEQEKFDLTEVANKEGERLNVNEDGNVTMLIDNAEGGLDVREVSWARVVEEETERLNNITARAEQLAACVKE